MVRASLLYIINIHFALANISVIHFSSVAKATTSFLFDEWKGGVYHYSSSTLTTNHQYDKKFVVKVQASRDDSDGGASIFSTTKVELVVFACTLDKKDSKRFWRK